MIEYPQALNPIFNKLHLLNIKPIIVGGYNRDYLLGRESKDIDIELYGINSYDELEKILREFGSVNSVGKSFGVCKLNLQDLDLDFSLPREDNKTDKGHKGFKITTYENLDFETAARRRDFTINAIGYDVIEKKILDPFFGIKDLKNKILSAVDITKFDEDPLRVLRAVQFSTRFEFSLDDTLFYKCEEMIDKGVLQELPKERIFEEIKKLFLKSKRVSLGFELLQKLHAFNFFKELSSLTQEQFTLLRESMDWYAKHKQGGEKKDLILFLSLLSFSLTQEHYFTLLQKICSEKKLIENVDKLIQSAKKIELDNFSNYDLYKLAQRVKIEDLLPLLEALNIGDKKEAIKRLRKKAVELDILNKPLTKLLQGRDLIKLNLEPSKEFSKLLDDAYEAQMQEEFFTKDAALLWLHKRIMSF